MLTATLDTSGISRLRSAVVGNLSTGLRTAVFVASEQTRQKTKATSLFRDRSGLLRDSIIVDALRSTWGRAEAKIRASRPYAWFVHAGTRAHEIRPRLTSDFIGPPRKGQGRRKHREEYGAPSEFAVGLGKFLRWEEEGGGVHFAREVKHPGTQPRPYLASQIPYAYSVLEHQLRNLVQTIARRWSSN